MFSENAERQTLAKGRYKNLRVQTNDQVKSREKECTPWLPIFMAVPAILGFCVKYQRQKGITPQSSKPQEQDKLQEG